MRFFLILCLLAAVISPVHADLQDTRFRVSEGQGLIWIGFDEQAHSVELTETSSGLSLHVSGVSLEPHTILPPDRSLVLLMQVEAAANDAEFNIVLARQWSNVQAELRQGGILVTISLTGDAPTSQLPDASFVSSAPEVPAEEPVMAPQDILPEPTGIDEELILARAANSVDEDESFIPPSAGERAIEEAAEIVGSCEDAAAAVELNPWDDTALANHASCLVESGDIVEAASIYEQMLAFEPENYDFAMALADIRASQGDMAAARALYDQATMNSMSDAEAVRARSQARAIRDQ